MIIRKRKAPVALVLSGFPFPAVSGYPAALVHLRITRVKRPTDLLQFPQPRFADQNRADRLEGVATAQTAARHELPMRTDGMVMIFYHNLDPGLPGLGCEPFTGTVIGLDLDTELAVESVIQRGCRRMDIQTALTFPPSGAGRSPRNRNCR